MRLERLTLSNFGPYEGEHSILIPSGVSFITGVNLDDPQEADSNAAGKTTLLHAITWALFGKTMNNLKSLPNDNLTSGEKVSVELRISGGHNIIRTWTKRGSSVVYENPVDGRLVGDTDKVNSQICALLGVSYPLFQNSLYLSKGSKSVQFLYEEPAKRAKILSELVDDSVFQRAAEILKTQRKEKEHRYSKFTHEISLREETIKKNLEQISRHKKDLEEVIAKERTAKSDMQQEAKRLRVKLLELNTEILNEPKDSMERLEELRIGLRKRILVNQEGMREHQLIPTKLRAGTTCHFCHGHITEENIDTIKELNNIRSKILDKLRQEQVTLVREMEALDERQEKIRKWSVMKAEKQAEMQKLNYELAYIQRRFEEITRGSDLLEAKIADLKSRNGEEHAEIERARLKSADLAQEIHVTSKLSGILSSEIRNLLFDKIRGRLESCTEQYARLIAGQMLFVQYPSVDKAGREKFEILLSRGEVSADLSTFSEGEVWRAAFAILLALRETLMSKSKCKLSLLLVDDPVGVLDKTGTQRFIEVLRKLADEGLAQTILVTIPKEDYLFGDRTIRVIKENKRARIG